MRPCLAVAVAPLLVGCTLDLVEAAPESPPLVTPFAARLDVSLTVARQSGDSAALFAVLWPGRDTLGAVRAVSNDTLRVGDWILTPVRANRDDLMYESAFPLGALDSILEVRWPTVAEVPTPAGPIAVRLPRRIGERDLSLPPAMDLILTFDMGATAATAPVYSNWLASLRGSGDYRRTVDGFGPPSSPLILPAEWLAEIEAGVVWSYLYVTDSYQSGAGDSNSGYGVGVSAFTTIRWTVNRTLSN